MTLLVFTPMICGCYCFLDDTFSAFLMSVLYLAWLGYGIGFIIGVENFMLKMNEDTRPSRPPKPRRIFRPKGRHHKLGKRTVTLVYKKSYKQRMNQRRHKIYQEEFEKKHPLLSDCGWAGFGQLPARYYIASYGEAWDKLCKTNPLIFDLMGEESFLRRYSGRFKSQFAFTGSNEDAIIEALGNGIAFGCESAYNASDGGPRLIFDTGASISVSPIKEDFISLDESEVGRQGHTLAGLTSHAAIKGIGVVRWLVYTDNGFARYIEQRAYYVPSATVRLFSVHRYCQTTGNGAKFICNDKGVTFHFSRSSGGGKMTFTPEQTGGLPITSTRNQKSRFKNEALQVYHNSRLFGLVHSDNINLTSAQKELLKWHFQLGHWNIQWIQALIRCRILHVKEKRASNSESICQCAACNLAKQKQKSEGTIKHVVDKTKDGNLKKDSLRPGANISTDQYVSSVPGRLPHTYGKEKEVDKYVGGTIFIDEASGFMYLKNQVSLGAAETICAKHEFEREAYRHGVRILGYRGDNGVYWSKDFRNDLEKFKQTIKFSPVGGHHHNGVAKRGIRTITTCTRAMMIHALIHNPTEVNMDLWPFAMEYAVFLWNKMPKADGGLSPEEIFYNIKSDYSHLHEARTWGCPAYVLDPTLQDGKKLPRWKPRSRLGQFVGRSREHANSIGMIRNLRTGAISPQFNVVYDDHFTTVGADITQDNIPVPDGFDDLMRFSRENVIDPEDLKPTNDTNSFGSKSVANSDSQTSVNEGAPLDDSGSGGEEPVPTSPTNTPSAPPSEKSVTFGDLDESDVKPEPSLTPASPALKPPAERRYPMRERRRTKHLIEEYVHTITIPTDVAFHDLFLYESNLDKGHSAMTAQFDLFNIIKQDDNDEKLLDGIHPFAFAARANAEDTPRWHEAMNGPDAEGFKAAMMKEIDQLQELDAFTIVPREKAVREGKKIIDSVWSFKQKRYPDGSVKKLKARLCMHGGQQEKGIDYDESFSPVVAWNTVRIMLILSIIESLQTKQVDFVLAFVQAELPPGTYIKMPRSFEKDGYIMELKRNLYGGVASGANFFDLLQDQLHKRGFEASEGDPCLFINRKTGCIILTYVDDCILFHKEELVIDDTLKGLESPTDKSLHHFRIQIEDDYAGFLGIDIHHHKDGTVELLQTGLIDRIITALNLNEKEATIRHTPADKEPLGKDEDGPPRKESWSYPSLVGMLLYLLSNSHPDIAYAVHSCARFNHCAKLSHEKGIKRIARYLKGTRNKGLIFDPKKDLKLEMYCDADFAGLWNSEKKDDPVCVKSRSGVLITLGGVPVTWKSSLQSEISTSPMHSEYVALSYGMRELLPTKRLVDDLCRVLKIRRDETTELAKVYEDNEGCLKLANSPVTRMTPQSKHFAVKLHWFRSQVADKSNNIKIVGVRSEDQKADIFTKGLLLTEFRRKRMLIMGW